MNWKQFKLLFVFRLVVQRIAKLLSIILETYQKNWTKSLKENCQIQNVVSKKKCPIKFERTSRWAEGLDRFPKNKNSMAKIFDF